MTCIIGYIDRINNKVILGGDSASITNKQIMIRKTPKVFKNGNFIFGSSGSIRLSQLLENSFKPPKIEIDTILEYMCITFVNEIRNCLREGGILNINNNIETMENDIIVGYKNRLFTIYSDFTVFENINDFISIGSGLEYALGSLHTTKDDNITIENKILLALGAASKYCTGVSEPFNLIST